MRRRTRRERITLPRGTMANRFKWACLELDTWRRLDVYAGQLAPNGHFRVYISCGYPVDSTYPKMLDPDWGKLPKLGVEALLVRLYDPLFARHACGAGIPSGSLRTPYRLTLWTLRTAERTMPRRSAGKNHHLM